MIFDTQLIRKTVERAEKFGLTVATGELLKDLEVTSISKSGTIPNSGPLLIISNHTGIFDSLLLLNQVERNDYFFIALSTYEIFGTKVKEKLIPIYRTRQLNHKIYEFPLALQINRCLPKNYSKQQIQLLNRDSITIAAQLIDKGSAVSIFPTGSAGRTLTESHWKAGIGYLVKQITNPQTHVVFVQILGTKQSDIVAYFHPFLRKLLFRPQPISVCFSSSYLLTQIIDQSIDAKLITKELEKLYIEQWRWD
jgi:hypothetical protein